MHGRGESFRVFRVGAAMGTFVGHGAPPELARPSRSPALKRWATRPPQSQDARSQVTERRIPKTENRQLKTDKTDNSSPLERADQTGLGDDVALHGVEQLLLIRARRKIE